MTNNTLAERVREVMEETVKVLQELPLHVTSDTTRLLVARAQKDLLDAIIDGTGDDRIYFLLKEARDSLSLTKTKDHE
jgi:uncharacterized protein (DUF2252 family)